MHEVSIALGMVNELLKIAEKNKAKKITNVKLKIGKLSGIVTDSLQFAFDAVKREYPILSSSEMFIEEVPLVYECNDCKAVFKTDDIYFPACQGCNSYNLKLISGEEQYIENVEVEV